MRNRYLRVDNSALLVRLAVAAVAFLILGIIGTVILFSYYARELPSPDNIVRREGFSTKIFDRNNKLLYDVYSGEKRTPVAITQIPQSLQQATVAIEDKNFYNNQGFDPLTPLRIIWNLIIKGRIVGGSGLTQQLVKNVLLTPEQTPIRKLKEFILAIQIDRKYTKDQILQMYLNEAPYGGPVWGVATAAETYFGKSVTELSLAESVIIAGLPQAPSSYSPYNGNLYIGRANDVLRRMREDGYINKSQETEAVNQIKQIKFATESGNIKAAHFVFYVKSLLEKKYGQKTVEQGGLKVITTLDLDLQRAAEQIIKEEIDKVKYLNITNGAAVVLDPKTGQILAMVGSRGWADPDYDGKFNVTTASRQPGSSIKPIVYLAGLRKGFTASTLLMDTKTSFPGGDKPEYVPENYDGKFRGPILMRDALGNSINVPAVKMLSMVGIRDTLQLAYSMGLSTLEPTKENLSRLGLSMALGGGEVKLLDMAATYDSFANGGKKTEAVGILEVRDSNDKVLEKWQPVSLPQIIDPGEAFIISSILSDPNARLITFGSRSAINIADRAVAVKTGTTNDKRDNWTIGWTPAIMVGVWVGNNNNSAMKELSSGVSGAAPIWRRILLQAFTKVPNESFVKPDNVVSMDVDKISGYQAHDNFDARQEYFVSGTQPDGVDQVHKLVRICDGSMKEYFFFREKDPFAVDGVNKWQIGIDGWLKDQADQRYHPSADGGAACGNQIWLTVKEPGDGSRINNNDVKIAVDISSSKPIQKTEFLVDGALKDTVTTSPWETTINMSDGSHQIDIQSFDLDNSVGSRRIYIGVNQDYTPPPTPTP